LDTVATDTPADAAMVASVGRSAGALLADGSDAIRVGLFRLDGLCTLRATGEV
jgi:hypothetical protein